MFSVRFVSTCGPGRSTLFSSITISAGVNGTNVPLVFIFIASLE